MDGWICSRSRRGGVAAAAATVGAAAATTAHLLQPLLPLLLPRLLLEHHQLLLAAELSLDVEEAVVGLELGEVLVVVREEAQDEGGGHVELRASRLHL